MIVTAAAVMLLGVGFEVVQSVTGVGGHALGTGADPGAYTVVELIAVAVCAARVLRRADDRLAWGFMTLGLLSWTAGDLVWTLWLDHVAQPPYPSLADGFYMAMFPATYAALMLLIRSRLRDAGRAQWLDGAVAGLAIAALAAALVFGTVLRASPGRLGAELVNAGYPAGDLMLLVFVALAFALAGWRPGRAWLSIGAGLALTAVADLIFTYQTALGTYRAGDLLDAAWPASMGLLAVAAWLPTRRRSGQPPPAPHTILVAVSSACLAVGVLVVATVSPVPRVAVALAAAALVLASIRGAVSYLETVHMLRRSAEEALTDLLSGLGNRRRLMQDLDDAFRASVDGVPSTLVFFDLNGFKRYNDSFGHAAGDALLARMGESLKRATAGAGRAYRLGGDEFCVLLDGRLRTGEPIVRAAAGALVERGNAFAVDASLGLAVIPDDAPNASGALQLADERMYADKAGPGERSRAQARDVLMALLNERTPELHEHVTGVGALATAVAAGLGLEGERLDELQRAAELHDIGKLAIPDAILDKPGPLSESEWGFMRQHPVIGERILSSAAALRPVARLVRASHERWDGTGYPDRLAGRAIPLGARVVAVCDAFEAMLADRCYQPARTRDEALAELRRAAGSQFDPAVVDVACAKILAGVSDRTPEAA